MKWYVSLKLNNIMAKDIAKRVQELTGDGIPADELHCTLMYSVSESDVEESPNDSVHLATVLGMEIMGEGDGRAITVQLNSETLHQRHDELKSLGLEYSYPEYKPHLSLVYSEDCDKWLTLLQNDAKLNILLSTGLLFDSESWEPLTD